MNDKHTAACEKARADWTHEEFHGQLDPYPAMRRLSPAQQQTVLACPHRFHDSVRQMFGKKAT